MRSALLCLAILLALPYAAQAEQVLDLHVDPAVAADSEHARLLPELAGPPADQHEEAFTVGLKIKSRSDVGSQAARATAQPSGPQPFSEKLEGIVERSSIGVTGTYRF